MNKETQLDREGKIEGDKRNIMKIYMKLERQN